MGYDKETKHFCLSKAEFKCSCLLMIEGWVTYKFNRDRYDFTQAGWQSLFAAQHPQHDCGECVDKPINVAVMSF